MSASITLTDQQIQEITDAFSIAMKYGYDHIPDNEKQVLLNGLFSWRHRPRNWEPMDDAFYREIEQFGCD